MTFSRIEERAGLGVRRRAIIEESVQTQLTACIHVFVTNKPNVYIIFAKHDAPEFIGGIRCSPVSFALWTVRKMHPRWGNHIIRKSNVSLIGALIVQVTVSESAGGGRAGRVCIESFHYMPLAWQVVRLRDKVSRDVEAAAGAAAKEKGVLETELDRRDTHISELESRIQELQVKTVAKS